MKIIRRTFHIWCEYLFILTLFFSVINPAYAYLDPGSGSFILQMIIAGLVTSTFVIKMYWERTKSFVKKLFSSKVQKK